jgi:mRNA-degrading endonuclease toxin of MazEF toxin-antitoxin module
VVVQSDHNNARLANSIFVMVSSNIRLAAIEPTQVLVDPATPEGAQSGLTTPSAVKCENVYTLPVVSVIRTIGRLPSSLMQQVDAALKASLALA